MSIGTHALVVTAGLFDLAFAGFHAAFPRLYHWDLDLRGATRRTQHVVRILNICLIFVLLLAAFLSMAHTSELTSTGVGRAVLVGFGLFWWLRAVLQATFFGLRVRPTITWGALFLLGGALHVAAALVAPGAAGPAR